MDNVEKRFSGDILIKKINLVRATFIEAGMIKDRLFEEIQLNNKKIIIDLSECDFIDSAFLGALVVSLKKIREKGGDIKIVSTSFTGGIINLVDYIKIFKNYSSIEDAVNSFTLDA